MQTADPKAQAAAKANVEAMSKQFRARYELRWSDQEAAGRLAAFTDNLWKIGDINVKSTKAGWWGALTKFSDR